MTEKPTDLVLVRHAKTGAQFPTRRSKVERHPEIYQIIDGRKARDVNGKPLPPKPRTVAEPVKPEAMAGTGPVDPATGPETVTEPAKPETQSEPVTEPAKPTPTAKRKEN